MSALPHFRLLIGFTTVALGILLIEVRAQETAPSNFTESLKSISGPDLLGHIRTLSSDQYGGRGPGSPGETLTVDYLTRAFKSLGLKPANPNGTYVQNVPMVGIQSESTASLVVKGAPVPITFPQDYVAWTAHPNPELSVTDSDLVFVGYGIQAPEYGWDDYKGLDVTGKTLVMLVNDPQIPDPQDPAQLDNRFFQGAAMTYYGRWTYKLEIAAKLGAAGVVLVHETGPAGYPYFVVINSWGRENFSLRSPDGTINEVPAASWFSEGRTRTLFSSLGLDFDELKQAALSPEFSPVPLEAQISFHFKNKIREIQSQNVLATLEGSHSTQSKDYIVVTAHWDHIGTNPKLAGDQIFNGALDNASGVAGMLELADLFAQLKPRINKSILFLATTAEEQGLLGAKFYAENPFVPMSATVANINIDGLNQWGRTKDLVIIGKGASELDQLVEQVAAKQGRTAKPDPESEKGFFYRSDHFQFAKQGVPALFMDSGVDYVNRAPGYGEEKRKEYTNNDYHKVSDEVKPDWDLSGAVEDLQLMAGVIYQISQTERWPEWNEGSEFKATRNESLKGKRGK